MKNALSLTTLMAACAIPAVTVAQTSPVPTSLSVVGSYETPVVIIPAEEAAAANSVQFGASNAITILVTEDNIATAVETFAQDEDELLNLVALTSFSEPVGAGEALANTGGDLPSVGTATFSGIATGTTATESSLADVSGDVNITVDFAAGSVDSAFTNMIKQELASGDTGGPLGATAWKDFSSTGSLVEGTGLFSGDAATTDGTLTGTVAGSIDGTNGATGLWSLTGAGESAFGGFTAAAE